MSRVMALSPLELDFRLTSRAVTNGLPPNSNPRLPQALEPVTDTIDAVSHLGMKVSGVAAQAFPEWERAFLEEQQNALWREFFSDPTKWRDYRLSKPTSRHPDFQHKSCRFALWLNNRHKPTWVDSQLATWDAVKRAPQSGATLVQGRRALATRDIHLDVEMCIELCESGRIVEAVEALDFLVQQGHHIHSNLFYRLLKRCIVNKDLVLGRRIHALTAIGGYKGQAFLATHLIGLYASHGDLEEAQRVFSEVPRPSPQNWATIIFAYAKHGEAGQAILLYKQMRESNVVPDNRIYVAVLKACATARDLVAGKDIHLDIAASPWEPDIFVQNILLDMYAKCGSVEDAREVFNRLPEKNVVTWTTMIAGYAQQGMGQEALKLYSGMQQEGHAPPNSVTFLCLLRACASVGVGALHHGMQLHAQIEELRLHNDVVLGSSLVNMYAKCGSLEDARRVFDRLTQRDVVTWTTMIAGYAQQGMGEAALSLYSGMQQEGLSPNAVTYACLLQACGSVGGEALHEGKHLHAQIEARGLQDDVVLGGNLVSMYAKCGSIEDARSLFDRLPVRNVVTWTAMIAGYAQRGMGQEALHLYNGMQQQGLFHPNPVTFVCLLQACASVGGLPLGKQLHAEIEEKGMEADLTVGNALVNMYAKCGSMLDAQQMFDSLPERTVEVWGALIGGYASQADSGVVFDLLDRMRSESVKPNAVIFLSVLTVCCHVGLLEKGRTYFEAMRRDYGISPSVEHYTCMVDLLGRAGHLHEALEMAKAMPFAPNGAVWHTLLGACRKWKDIEIGQQVFDLAMSSDAKDDASYVLMSNIYASIHMDKAAKEMQALRVKSGAWKKPGESWWTDMDGMVHRFTVGEGKYTESSSSQGWR